MKVTVLFFASLAERLGTRRMELAVDSEATVASVRDRLVAEHPEVAEFVPNLMYALDEEYVTVDAPLHEGATVALIPPVSGG